MGKPKNSKTRNKQDQNPTVDKRTFHGINKRTRRKNDDLKFKKFIGNKQQGQGFADRRKSKVMYEYQKIHRKQQNEGFRGSSAVQRIYDEEEVRERQEQAKRFTIADQRGQERPRKKVKMSAYQKAEKIWKQKQEEKDKRKKELEEIQKQRESAQAKYRQKKKDNYKKLAVKNYKGQPNMASQMDLLLGKIQQKGGK